MSKYATEKDIRELEDKIGKQPWLSHLLSGAIGFIAAAVGFFVSYGNVQADVQANKEQIRSLRPMVENVASIKTSICEFSRRLEKLEEIQLQQTKSLERIAATLEAISPYKIKTASGEDRRGENKETKL